MKATGRETRTIKFGSFCLCNLLFSKPVAPFSAQKSVTCTYDSSCDVATSVGGAVDFGPYYCTKIIAEKRLLEVKMPPLRNSSMDSLPNFLSDRRYWQDDQDEHNKEDCRILCSLFLVFCASDGSEGQIEHIVFHRYSQLIIVCNMTRNRSTYNFGRPYIGLLFCSNEKMKNCALG